MLICTHLVQVRTYTKQFPMCALSCVQEYKDRILHFMMIFTINFIFYSSELRVMGSPDPVMLHLAETMVASTNINNIIAIYMLP